MIAAYEVDAPGTHYLLEIPINCMFHVACLSTALCHDDKQETFCDHSRHVTVRCALRLAAQSIAAHQGGPTAA
jgi:hypothetical protein